MAAKGMSNMVKVAQDRINKSVMNPATPKSKLPPRDIAPSPKPFNPALAGSVSSASPSVPKPGKSSTPKPFTPGFTAGKSGKSPRGLMVAAQRRLANGGNRMSKRKPMGAGGNGGRNKLLPKGIVKKQNRMNARGVKWLSK